jgi:tetratricopeptide (TPR) repeat protein
VDRGLMKARFPLAAIVLPLMAVLVSCGGASSYLDVIKSNAEYSRGRYQEAIIGYFNALERGGWADILGYDLGNAYYRLGEETAADDNWKKGLDSKVPDARFRSYFNRGVVAYEGGDYDSAAEYFKKALEIDGSSVDAKIDLEYSLKNRQRQKALVPQEASPVARKFVPQSAENLLEFMTRKERDRWENRIQPPGGSDPNDY